MGDKSAIEWTDATWNPTTGCDQVSPGCDHCYALTLAKRLKAMGQPKYQRDGDPRTSGPGFALTVHENALDIPRSWRAPRRVFVNSMSDLFHPKVPDEFIARVFAVMALADHHTFQVLTKRPKRMRALLTSQKWQHGYFTEALALLGANRAPWPVLPLPNVWLGTSVEDQQRADERIPALLDTPAAVSFLSMEPLLGPVDLVNMASEPFHYGLGWIIVGGESGPGARPMHPQWARDLRDQAVAFGVPFLFKQWGAWAPLPVGPEGTVSVGSGDVVWTGLPLEASRLVGKHAAGRELDGRTWDEFPEPVPA
jgi:protein gp37